MNITKKAAVLFGVLGLTAGTVGTIAFQTHAATSATTTGTQTTTGFRHMTPPAAAGSVTAVNGNTFTVTDKRSGTTYTVDASNATIQKFTPPAAGTTPAIKPTPQTITASQIQVGDNVMVQGTVSGSNITATSVMDGMSGFGGGFRGHGAMGTVSAISGNTITLTGKNGTTYTVDAGSATVKKVSDSSVSNIAVGDTLMVNGTTSGTTITANNITDGVLGK